MPKKVIKKEEFNCVFSQNVSLDMIYAGWATRDGHIFIINRIAQQDGMNFKTSWLCCDDMPNLYYEGDTLESIIEDLLDHGYGVFEFGSEVELAKWILDTAE